MQTIEYIMYGQTYQLQILLNHYERGGTSIEFVDIFGGGLPEIFNDGTVRLEKQPDDYAYLDVNNFPDIERLFQFYNLGTPTGQTRQSGFVIYPLYHLNLDEIRKYLFLPRNYYDR